MKAAIDLGSNMAQLLIVEDNGIEHLYQEFTSLGEGTFETGVLSTLAIDRTIKVLTGFKGILQKNLINPQYVVFCATEACRRAKNRNQLFNQLLNLGFSPNCLSEEQEALFGCLGAMSQLVKPGQDYLCIDIGGASTEISQLNIHYKLEKFWSLKIGTLSTVEWLKNQSHQHQFNREKSKYALELNDYQKKSIICTRGTMTTLFNLALNNLAPEEKSFHGYKLEPHELHAKLDLIQSLPHEKLLLNFPYIAKRLTTLKAAIEILYFLMDLLNPKELILSERGLVHGALIDRES